MLSKLFRHIGRQSKPVRNRYAMGFAGVFTGLVALIWFINTGPFKTPVQMAGQPLEQSEGTFYTLTKQIKEQVAGLGEAIGGEEDGLVEGSDVDEEGEVAPLTEEVKNEEETQPNIMEIKLSQEDIETIGSKGSTSVNTGFGSSTPKYQEVLIATTSSSKAETPDQAEEGF